MTFYDRVYQTAKNRGLSIKQLAQKMGVSDATIYTWKKTGAPTGKNLTLVSKTLGVSVDYLLGNTDEMHTNKKSTDNEPVDIKKVAENDTWDDYLSSDGRPLSDHDKKLLRAIFGD